MQLLHSAAPREFRITAIIELGFASCDYCINLHFAAPGAINSVIALWFIRNRISVYNSINSAILLHINMRGASFLSFFIKSIGLFKKSQKPKELSAAHWD